MTNKQQFPPDIVRVALALPKGGQLIGLVGLLETFDAANRVRAARGHSPLFETAFVGLAAATASASGLVVETLPISKLPDGQTDMVLVGGGLDDSGRRAPTTDARFRSAVGDLAQSATHVGSTCTGAFVLGELGYLDNTQCTTHWLALAELQTRFPTARVELDALYTEDNNVFTAAGATSATDLALHLVRKFGGSRLALSVARTLVVFAHRPGGQSQFGSTLQTNATVDDRIRRVIADVIADPASPHRVDDLASRCAMSSRNFARVFRAETDLTPAAFVVRVRVEAAQRLLALGDESLEAVAAAVGFGTLETLRRAFVRVASVTPSAYRNRFGNRTPVYLPDRG